MTNLNDAKIGFNQFCGPAVLSIITGKNSDECASVISSITGKNAVKGVLLPDLLMAADRLGFGNEKIELSAQTLFGTISRLIFHNGIYIVTVTGHFIVIEINDKKAYLCDNHTKEPIRAEASARLSMKVVNVNRIFPKPVPKLLSTRIRVVKDYNTINVFRDIIYDDHTDTKRMGTVYVADAAEFQMLIAELNK